MQTALVEVIHTDGRTHHARILFDTGSSRSFVTDSLQRRANLKVTGQDDIALATFGSPVRRTSQYSRVELQIKTNGGSVQALSANVIPEITSPHPEGLARREKASKPGDSSAGRTTDLVLHIGSSPDRHTRRFGPLLRHHRSGPNVVSRWPPAAALNRRPCCNGQGHFYK